MQPPLATGPLPRTAPTFHVLQRQPPRPAAILLAIVCAAAVLSAVSFGLGHSKARRFADRGGANASRTPGSTGGSSAQESEDDKDDDPSQVDTIVVGDAADAPVPARKSDRVSPVHATVLVRLPRYGDQVGLIPDTPAGHLLYKWLAAFNQGSSLALDNALPNAAPDFSEAAQMVLRHRTGGFNLLSAKEIEPGLMVFRLRDQTPLATEVLGTLHVRPKSSPAEIASLSLRAVPPPAKSSAVRQPDARRNSSPFHSLREMFSHGH